MERTEYICSYCGRRCVRLASQGRPAPGNCMRKEKTKDGKMKPHTWVFNRKLTNQSQYSGRRNESIFARLFYVQAVNQCGRGLLP